MEWSLSGRFTPRERNPGTHWIKSWVAPKPVWTRLWGEEFPPSTGTQTPDHPALSPALYHWAINIRVLTSTWWNKLVIREYERQIMWKHEAYRPISVCWASLTHSLSPWIRVLPEELTFTQLIKNYLPFCNPKVHYRVHNSPPLLPILSQRKQVHNFPPHIPKIQFNIILLCPTHLTVIDLITTTTTTTTTRA